MLLRDHPPKPRHGFPNWPPLGTWIRKLENTRPKVMISVLKSTVPSVSNSLTGSFCPLTAKTSYIGCLLFDDYAFGASMQAFP